MLDIVEHIATEELLKIYFFKLYARKNELPIYILEDELSDIINRKNISQMVSNELFDCIKIQRSGYGIDGTDSNLEPFDDFIPSKFYYIRDIGNEKGTIFEHPFLYTGFKLIDGLNLYEAEIGLCNLGCDLINENGIILKTVTPNLYDNGFYEIRSLSKDLPILSLCESDENNGDWLEYYSFKDDLLNEIDEFDDKEILLAAVSLDGKILRCASEELRNDREIVLKAVSIEGAALYFASEELRNDREIVFAAISNDIRALKYAGNNFKNDKDFVHKLLSIDGATLEFASEKLRNDREIVLKAVSKNGTTLEFASEELRNDREIVIAAISNDIRAFKYVGNNFKNDSEILAIKKNVQKNMNLSDSDDSIFDDLPF